MRGHAAPSAQHRRPCFWSSVFYVSASSGERCLWLAIGAPSQDPETNHEQRCSTPPNPEENGNGLTQIWWMLQFLNPTLSAPTKYRCGPDFDKFGVCFHVVRFTCRAPCRFDGNGDAFGCMLIWLVPLSVL